MEQKLILQNPLWEDPDLIQDAPQVKRLDGLPFQYRPRSLPMRIWKVAA